jgi:hypothetical protein
MIRLEKARWMIAGVLIISALAVFGYRTAQSSGVREEIRIQEGKERNEQKVKTGLPMWESLSRHLITIQR